MPLLLKLTEIRRNRNPRILAGRIESDVEKMGLVLSSGAHEDLIYIGRSESSMVISIVDSSDDRRE